jgi:hypothetical protein
MKTFFLPDFEARKICFLCGIADVTDFLKALHQQKNTIPVYKDYNPEIKEDDIYTAIYEDYIVFFMVQHFKIIAVCNRTKPEFEPNPPPSISSRIFEIT